MAKNNGKKIYGNENDNENENENKTGEATYRGALRAPLAGSPAFVFVFVFIVVLLSVKFFGPQLIRENLNFSQQIDQILTSNPTQPPPHLTPPINKKTKKTKCV